MKREPHKIDVPTISEQMNQGARTHARNFFDSLEKVKYIEISSFETYDRLMTDIAALVSPDQKIVWRDAYGSAQFSEIVKVFLQELATLVNAYVRTHGHSRMQKIGVERMQNTVIKIEQALFTQSPNILNALTTEDRFEIAALFGRTPELDGRPYQECLATLTELITFASARDRRALLNEQVEQVLKRSVAEQVAFVDLLQRMISLSFGQGYDHDAFVYHAGVQAIAACARRSPYPLVKQSAQYAEKWARLTFHLNEHDEINDIAFYNEIQTTQKYVAEDNSFILKHCVPDVSLGRGEYFRKISQDYVGLFTAGAKLELVARMPERINLYRTDGHKIALQFQYIEDVLHDPVLLPTAEERDADTIAYALQILHRPEIRERMEKTLGLFYRNLPLDAQMQLLKFVSEQDGTTLRELETALKDMEFSERQTFLSAFFSCAADPRAGHALIAFARQSSGYQIEEVVGDYQHLLEALDDIKTEAANFFDKKSLRVQPSVRPVVQEFMRRATALLVQACEQPERAYALFSSLKHDVAIFTSIFKSEIRGGAQFNLREIVGLDVQSLATSEISEPIKQAMIEIARANWLPRGAVGREVAQALQEKLNSDDEKMRWHILTKQGEPLSFVRFDALPSAEDGRTHEYAGSFNVHPQYRGSTIGDAMIREVLNSEAERAVLHATMDPRIDVGIKYVEDTGFLVTGIADNYLGTDESFFEITCDREQNKKFETRSWSAEKTVAFCQAHVHESVAQQIARGDVVVLNVTRAAGREPEFVAGARAALRAGYVGARYVADPAQPQVRYMVFEKLQKI